MPVRPFVGTFVVLALASGTVAGASTAFAGPVRERAIHARTEQLHRRRPTAAVLHRSDVTPTDPSTSTTAAPAVQAPATPSVAAQSPAVAQMPAVLLTADGVQFILSYQQRLAEFYAGVQRQLAEFYASVQRRTDEFYLAVQRGMIRDYLRGLFVADGLRRWGAQMACIRNRESHGNYSVMSRGGVYRGAYQYAQRTWNNAAGAAGRGDLVGVNPATVAPIDQDQVTIAYMDVAGLGAWGGRCR
ncbi:MAG: hypothetical protein JWL73_2276 [Actinomycetia bacterium]|nr:hypothetical protein [Actinomycetes bacterium]